MYYFSAKLAPPKYAALASWITGWANVTGQVTLVCSIDFTWYDSGFYHVSFAHKSALHSAQMITTALSVGSNGSVNLGNGPTFGILLAILFTHGIICSAGTAILARINIFYVVVNRTSSARHQAILPVKMLTCRIPKLVPPLLPSFLCLSVRLQTEFQLKTPLPNSKTTQDGQTVGTLHEDIKRHSHLPS